MGYVPAPPPPSMTMRYRQRIAIKSAFNQAKKQQKANFEIEQAKFIKGP